MSSKKPKIRRTRIDLVVCETKADWHASTLTFKDYSLTNPKEVVITIREPYELAYIREKLNEIVAHWAKLLKGVQP